MTSRSFSSAIALTAALALVSAASAQTPAPTPTTPATPPAPPGIVWNFTGDIYYGYNFNKPPINSGSGTPITGPGYRNFDYKDNIFTIGLIEAGASKAVTDTSRFGFTIKLGFGPTADLIASPGDSDNKNIIQAYGTYLVPFGKNDLTVDAGKMVTHMGNEVIEPSGNWNFSRSDLFQYFIPYYHAGVRAAYPLTPTVTATGYVYNGWNDVSFDTNNNKAYGLEVAFAPSPSTTWTFNGLTSNEPAGVMDEPKTTLEGIWSHTLTKSLQAVVDVNYDFGKSAASNEESVTESSWQGYGAAGYLRYTFKNGNALSLRGEYARDPQGFLFGVGDANIKEATVTYSVAHNLYKGGELRLEYRYDASSQPGLFIGTPYTHQNTLTIAELFTF